MRDRDLDPKILGVQKPWTVSDVQLNMADEEVLVRVEWKGPAEPSCPECGEQAPGYDQRQLRTARAWTIKEASRELWYYLLRGPAETCLDEVVGVGGRGPEPARGRMAREGRLLQEGVGIPAETPLANGVRLDD